MTTDLVAYKNKMFRRSELQYGFPLAKIKSVGKAVFPPKGSRRDVFCLTMW